MKGADFCTILHLNLVDIPLNILSRTPNLSDSQTVHHSKAQHPYCFDVVANAQNRNYIIEKRGKFETYTEIYRHIV